MARLCGEKQLNALWEFVTLPGSPAYLEASRSGLVRAEETDDVPQVAHPFLHVRGPGTVRIRAAKRPLDIITHLAVTGRGCTQSKLRESGSLIGGQSFFDLRDLIKSNPHPFYRRGGRLPAASRERSY